MSNQESSSVRVLSGIAFAGDPLSDEVSTPSISFTESVPQVASRPGDEEVTGPVRELESTSGRVNEKE